MPTTRKRHQQQQQQQLQLQSEHHDKQSNGQNNNGDTSTNGGCQSQQNQPSSRGPLAKVKATKDNVRLSSDQNEKSAVHRDIQAMLEGDLYCAICREIYIDPLILNCAHSFCKFCLNHWLSKQVGCPSCRMVVVFQTENLALKDIVNKMIKTSSPEFQQERAQSLTQRSEAEIQQKARGVRPMMEKRSFNLYGKARTISNRRANFIRSWRGPNGATIWQTKLDDAGQVVRPEVEDDSSSTDYDEDGDYDEDEDEEFDHDDDSNLSLRRRFVERLLDGEPEDESVASTIDIDSSDESYVSSRRQRMNDLNILAGIVAADDDEDFEIEAMSNGYSDGDSSVQGMEVSNSDESAAEVFGVWRLGRGVPRGRTPSEEDSDDTEEDHVVGEEDDNREAVAFSADSSEEYTSSDSSSSFTSGETDDSDISSENSQEQADEEVESDF